MLPPGWNRAYANGINNAGCVVGWGYEGTTTKGFIYNADGYTELLPVGWRSAYARGINNVGVVVGAGSKDGTKYEGFIATPVNQPPKAMCQNVTVSAGTTCTAPASIDKGSYDPDGDSITLAQSPPGPYPKGSTLVTLTVADNKCASSQCAGAVTVVDRTPPAINSISVNPAVLWPPNHKTVSVAVNVSTSDNCDKPFCKITSVTSNEPVNGLGDGDTAPDWKIAGDLTVNLRAERSGKGSGRIYTITTTCTDASNNNSNGTVTVNVPHEQRGK